MAEPLERLWDAVMGLAERRKEIPLRGKLWIAKAGDWTIVVNGCTGPQRHDGFTISPYNGAVWFGDWLAGTFSPYQGAIAAGTLANIDTLIAAMEASK